MSSSEEGFLTALDVACAALPMILYAAPLSVFYRVFWVKTATTVEIPPLPLTGMLLQCSIWLAFCSLSGIIPGIIHNAFGLAIGLVFLVLYEKCHKRSVYGRDWRRHLRGLAVVGVLVAVFAGLAGAWQGNGGAEEDATEPIISVFGWLGLVTAVVFLGHPLASMARVLLTNNVEAMGSTAMNLCALFAGVAWFVNAAFFLESGGLQIAIADFVCILANVAALSLRWKLRNVTEIVPEDEFVRRVRKLGPWWEWLLLGGGADTDSQDSAACLASCSGDKDHDAGDDGRLEGAKQCGTVGEAAKYSRGCKNLHAVDHEPSKCNASSTSASERVPEGPENRI
eukprot:g12974.t1